MSGKSKFPRALAVAPALYDNGGLTELPFLIGPDSPLPDISLLEKATTNMGDEWRRFRFDQAALTERAGELPRVEFEQSRALGFGRFAPIHDTLPAGDGDDFMYWEGDIPVTVPLLSVPTVDDEFADLTTTALARLLDSGASPVAAVTTRTVAVSGATDQTNFAVAAAPAGMVAEAAIALDEGGRRWATLVSNVSGGNITTLTQLGASGAQVGNTIRIGQTWRIGAGNLGYQAVLRGDGAGWRDYAFGRWSALRIAASRRMATFAFTMRCPIIFDSSSDADVGTGANVLETVVEPAGTQVGRFTGTKPVLGTEPSWAHDNSVTIPVEVAGEVLPIDEFNVSITNTLGKRGNFDGLGGGDFKVDDVEIEVSLMLSAPPSAGTISAIRDAATNYHPLMLPIGPTGAHGGLIAFPALSLVNDPKKLDLAKEFSRTMLTFRAGPGIFTSSPTGACAYIALF